MLVATVVMIEMVAVSKLHRRLLTVMMVAMTTILAFAASPETARAADAGAITIGGDVATQYDAYQLFWATVTDKAGFDQKVATDLAWASDAARQAVLPVLYDAGFDSSASTAQEAAEWLNADGHMSTALAARLACAICNAGAASVPLNAGMAAELPCGYWLIVADDDAIDQDEAGTAPIMALVGGSAVTVKPKAATPKVSKHVLEDSAAAWQKAADATVADDLYWRLSATVPAGLTAYDTYTVRFVDTMSAGLDPSKVAASMRVYVAAGADGHVELSGVDAGVYTVEEVAAPKGYTAFEGKRTVTVTSEGLDVKQVAAAKPKVTVSAESPLRVDTADAGTGSIELSVLNTPSKEASRGFMPSMGDRTLVLVAALAAIGVAAIVVALVIKRGGGRREK